MSAAPPGVVVLGGGSAGWITAALLAKRWGGAAITVIESPEIGIIGVGEGSTPQLKAFFDNLGIAEDDWMPACDATYKLGIQFNDWFQKGRSYFHPFGTYGTRIDAAFAKARLKPQVALEALDSDVIKTYVRLGLGIGIVAEMAVRDEPPDGELVWHPVGHLFGLNVARVAFRRGAYLRHFVYTFAELLSERLTRALIQRAMSGGGADYQM